MYVLTSSASFVSPAELAGWQSKTIFCNGLWGIEVVDKVVNLYVVGVHGTCTLAQYLKPVMAVSKDIVIIIYKIIFI